MRQRPAFINAGVDGSRAAGPAGHESGASGSAACFEGGLQISHETIYLHIYADKRRGGDLWQHLRCQKPRRKRYASGQEHRGTIKNRIGIDERPEIVDQKSRIGDWEGDTVIGKNHRGALVTLAERKSRYILAAPVPGKHAPGVTAAVTRLLRPIKASATP